MCNVTGNWPLLVSAYLDSTYLHSHLPSFDLGLFWHLAHPSLSFFQVTSPNLIPSLSSHFELAFRAPGSPIFINFFTLFWLLWPCFILYIFLSKVTHDSFPSLLKCLEAEQASNSFSFLATRTSVCFGQGGPTLSFFVRHHLGLEDQAWTMGLSLVALWISPRTLKFLFPWKVKARCLQGFKALKTRLWWQIRRLWQRLTISSLFLSMVPCNCQESSHPGTLPIPTTSNTQLVIRCFVLRFPNSAAGWSAWGVNGISQIWRGSFLCLQMLTHRCFSKVQVGWTTRLRIFNCTRSCSNTSAPHEGGQLGASEKIMRHLSRMYVFELLYTDYSTQTTTYLWINIIKRIFGLYLNMHLKARLEKWQWLKGYRNQ